VYQYVRGNLDYSIHYKSGNVDGLVGYVDASYANNPDCKSTSGYLFFFNGGLVSWSSKKQSVWARSAAEAEYYAADGGAKEMLWFKQWLEDVDLPQGCVTIYEDNEACIALTKNPQFHNKTKHIGVLFHAVRDLVERKECEFIYIKSKSQLADICTKSLTGPILRNFLVQLGMTKGNSKSAGELDIKDTCDVA